jgi:hypothetical protein
VSVNSGRTRGWRAALMAVTLLAPALVPQSAALAAAPTDAPTLTSPDPGVTVSSNPTLAWDAVAGAARYRVQVSTSAAFSSFVYNADTYNTRATPTTDLPLGTLYWRVAGMDGSNALGPYASSSFDKAWGEAPALTAPADGATLTYPDDPPLFTWEPLPGAKSYKIEVDDASDFVSPQTSAITNNTSFTLTEPQTIEQTFFWRVQGISGTAGVNSDWSPTRSYEVEWPAVPNLVSPANTNVTAVEDVVLNWDPVVGAAGYQVQVSPNADWANNVVIDEIVYHTSFSPPQGLNNGAFFWRVRAKDFKGNSFTSANAGGWSEEWTFTRGWPDRPTLLTPTNGDFSVTVPKFTWTPVDHAAYYEINVGPDQNFSPGTFMICFTNHTEFTPYARITGSGEPPGTCNVTGLNPGTTYYWRVRGVDTPNKEDTPNAPALGLWSNTGGADTFSFIFRPDIPTPVAPADGAAVATPVLQWDAVDGIAQYKVTIQKANGSTANIEETYALSYTPPNLVAADGPFKWTVQTIDTNGKIGLLAHVSTWRTFTLAAPTTTTELNLLTPADGGTSVRMPSMTWEPYTGADKYTVFYGVAGSGVSQTLGSNLKLAGFTYNGEGSPTRALSPGTYFWYVEAYNATGGYLESSPQSTFTITSFDVASYTSPAKCIPTNSVCEKLPDTPTLTWPAVDLAGGYIVYVANDADFTNEYREYWTIFPTLTPRESYVDNQAGQAYYWFVRPCISGSLSPCGPYNSSVHPLAYAFQKKSAPIERLTPDPNDTVTFANEVTFSWRDYLATNGALDTPATQESRWYRVQVASAADFAAASILDDEFVDETKFTSWRKTYPEGPIYWRVQAIDGTGNALTFSAAGSGTLTKNSPAVTLDLPANGATSSGVPFFKWNAQAFAKEYEIQIARNGDTLFSSANLVFGSAPKTKLSAWSPTSSFAAGDYAWRVRRLDVTGKPGPWSAARTFTYELAAPTLVSPADDHNFSNNNVLFDWGAVQGAVQYRVQVSTASTFTSLYENQATVMTSWAPTKLYGDGGYYWRVQVLDAAGNVLSTSAVRHFTKDGSPPIVTAKSPTSNASITGTFSVTFSEPVTGVTATTFKMVIAGTASLVAGAVATPSATTATFKPSAALMPGQSYTLSLTGGIEDLSGNPLIATSWTVRTALLVEQNSPATFEVWDRDYTSSASAGAYDGSRTSYSKTIFTFTGTNVTLLGRRATDGGYANVYLDGVYQGKATFYASTTQWKVPIYAKSGLADAKHTLDVRVTGTKPTASSNTWVYIDAFKVGTVSYEENHSAVRDYFKPVSTASAGGGSYDTTTHTASGDTGTKPFYQVSFKGTGIDWYATKTASSGTAAVYIDNVSRGSVNLYSASTVYKSRVYSSPTLTNGTHVLRIYLNGSKSTASKGYDVSLDWVTVR